MPEKKEQKRKGCNKKRRVRSDVVSSEREIRNDSRNVIKMYKRLVYLGKRSGKTNPLWHAREEAMKSAKARGPAVVAALQRHIKGERP